MEHMMLLQMGANAVGMKTISRGPAHPFVELKGDVPEDALVYCNEYDQAVLRMSCCCSGRLPFSSVLPACQ